MKDAMDSTAAVRAPEPEAFTSRKLIRPSLSNGTRNESPRSEPIGERRERPNGGKKNPPAEQTHAENFYYQKQIATKTPLVILLRNGDEIHGTLEWYDKTCVKVNRNGGSNVLIYKQAIKYMYKESER
ncbi:MAG TPA: RNA chaperone Hfq [Terriglobales bacterium]|nr:RNA chaperone Hfq [Terriglobales bacterium]